MKKLAHIAFISILFASLLLVGCDDSPDSQDKTLAQGKLLILQAYGNGPMTGDSPGGVSNSFVELYNIASEPIDLIGIGLYYANGIRGSDVTEDEPWERIALSGTIPANGSFLILGARHPDLSSTRYEITETYGDINDDALILGRRSFKVALIDSVEPLTVQNPFAGNDGKPVPGYIDMVGTMNNPTASNPDNIFGYETAPARNSASEAVRRKDRFDYDNNSTDFGAARYANDNDGMTTEELKVRKPRNSSAGAWDPFADPAEPVPTEGLLLLQAYGSSSNADGVSHSFVELYNNTDTAINLEDHFLWYANGTSVSSSNLPNTNTRDESWNVINLTGAIPGKTSFLVLGPRQNTTGRLQIVDGSGDINNAGFILSNRAFKVTLIQGTTQLTDAVQNPFDIDGNGTKVDGYLDMAGSANEYSADGSERDRIFGFETAPARNSASVAIRRNTLSDTDNNSEDFASIDYRVWSASNPNRTTDEQLEVYRPKNLNFGAWNPQDGSQSGL